MSTFRDMLASLRDRKKLQEEAALMELKARYHAFRIFLENNGRALELIVSLDALLNRGEEEDIRAAAEELMMVTGELVDGLNLLSGERHADLYAHHGMMAGSVADRLNELEESAGLEEYCVALDDLDPGAVYLSGAKAANLARLRRTGLPVPNGFVCTTRAFKKFLHQGSLAADISRLLERLEAAGGDVYAVAANVREMILGAPLPSEVAEALAAAYARLESAEPQTIDGSRPAISVRSSGVSEDGADHSFAGQFTSVLNVRGLEDLEQAYREVVASSFSARAISYRRNARLPVVDFHFAVLCQEMAEAECAGVLFTREPAQPDSGRMVISAVPGLGTTAVGGSTTTDLYRPARRRGKGQPQGDRDETMQWSEAELYRDAEISHKTMREVPVPGGGVTLEPVPEVEADRPLLDADTLRELVSIGELVENLEGTTQDIEWAYSATSGIAVLQARPLRVATKKDTGPELLPAEQPIVTGICAVAGKAVGQARLAHSAAELREVERSLGAGGTGSSILVLPQSIVDAVPLMPKCAGLVIEVGNPTDHLSCIAREYGIPMITGAQSALSGLGDGQWIVLDAERGQVFAAPDALVADITALHAKYRSEDQPAAPPEKPARRSAAVSPERQTLRKMIVPLNLTDAYGATFSRAECRSIHDIVRYTHEMAVLAMFDTGDMIMEQAGGLLRPLEIGVPFSFLVIDVGGGVRKSGDSSWRKRLAIHRPLSREDILSFPLAALCDGLTTPGLSWHSGPDIEALSGIFSRSLLDSRGPRPAGSFNYALAARDYLNLNARVEFHFAMLDTVCGRDSHANYIRFRFKGGGAGVERGRRRADFLKHVFEKNSFYTSVAGDLITASLTGASKEIVTEKLVMIGRLLGFSRFLDGIMATEETPLIMAKAFLAGDYDARDHLPSGEEC